MRSSDFFKRGFGIIFVLGMITLLSGLIISFLKFTQNEGREVGLTLAQEQAKMAGEGALDWVKSQLDQATKDKTSIWTSQPGLIRTYQAREGSQKVYKLYSALVGKMTSSGEDLAGDQIEKFSNPAEGTDLNAPVQSMGRRFYPILDADVASQWQGRLKGFKNEKGNSPSDYAMNVRWIYQLEDGRLVNYDELDPKSPPIARFAFWTDDESCKVNLNTAGEGSYWNAPYTDSEEDVKDSLIIPLANEFQRLPGHPATVSLSAVLNEATLGSGSPWSLEGNRYAKSLFPFLPRIEYGGTEGGTVDSSTLITLDREALLETPQELFFRKERGGEERSRMTVDAEKMKAINFLVTTESRSPDETVFSTPRITSWPFHTNESKWSLVEKRLAEVSSYDEKKFYFQREKANSLTFDYHGIARNQNLFSYLEKMTQKTISGYGASLESKYQAQGENHQILTEIFDYIRSGPALQAEKIANSYTRIADTPYGKAASGLVYPILIGDSKGFGRFPTISSAGFRFRLHWCIRAGAINTNFCQFLFQFQPYQVSPGMTPLMLDQGMKIQVDGLSQMNVGGTAVYPSTSSTPYETGANYFVSPTNAYDPQVYYSPLDAFMSPVFSFSDSNMLIPSNLPWLTPTFNPLGATLNLPVSNFNYSVSFLDSESKTFQKLNFNSPAWTIISQASQLGVSPGLPPTRIAFDYFLNPSTALSTVAQWNWTSYTYQTMIKTLGAYAASASRGDLRIVAGQRNSGTDLFSKSRNYDQVKTASGAQGVSHDWRGASDTQSPTISRLGTSGNVLYDQRIINQGGLVNGFPYQTSTSASPWSFRFHPAVPYDVSAPKIEGSGQMLGDWDTGGGNFGDGPYINKPVEMMRNRRAEQNPLTHLHSFSSQVKGVNYNRRLAFTGENDWGSYPYSLYYSPQRQLPSPVMFGSLSTGVKRARPWQTLLFNPMSAADAEKGAKVHPGWGTVPDHLYLDFFRMPVAEPWAISDPFTTAGKININYEMIPFKHLKRATGIYALLKASKITAIDVNQMQVYKTGFTTSQKFRYDLNMEAMEREFERRFKSPLGAFRTDSEICDLRLYPNEVNYSEDGSSLYSWWRQKAGTGDNLRERPYVDLYPRITTRSNVFKVYIRAQSLKKVKGTDSKVWVEGKDQVLGEYRGSYTLERVLPEKTSKLPDFAMYPEARLADYYRIRVRSHEQFVP